MLVRFHAPAVWETVTAAGLPGQLYLEPVQQRTMALVGFPPANFLPGTLESANGQPRCRTALFESPVETRNGPVSEGPVNVGIRPEIVEHTPRTARLPGLATSRPCDDTHAWRQPVSTRKQPLRL